jgi:hypothetical protein
MSISRRLSILLLQLIFIYALSGCGGSGGDGGSAISSESSKLSEENAVEVASIILKSTARSSEAANSANASRSAGSVSSSSSTPKISDSDLARLAGEAMKQPLDKRQGVSSDIAAGRVIGPQTINCDGSGTFTVTWDDVNNDGILESGDMVEFNFSQCSFANTPNTVYNGQLSRTISSPQVGTDDFRFTNFVITQSGETSGFDGLMRLSLTADGKVSIEFDNLKFTQNDETNTFDGDIAISVQTQDNIIVDTTVSGNKLALSNSDGTSTLSRYEYFTQVNNSTKTYTRRENGSITIDQQRFSGTIDFETLQNFEGELGKDPFVGEEKFTSQEDGSSVLLTADGDNVIIEVDEDGDGNPDKKIDTTWEELRSQS